MHYGVSNGLQDVALWRSERELPKTWQPIASVEQIKFLAALY
jgi:hypothetical protein